jgi:Concanavalin A-like lectin/glucanases superfamily
MKKSTLLLACLSALAITTQSCQKEAVQKDQQQTVSSEDELMNARLNDSSLLCYYPFNSNLKDKSGHGNNGSLAGTVSYVPDRFGTASRAVSFAAGSSYIEIPQDDFLGVTNMTISMNFFATSSARQLLLSKITYGIPYTSPDFNSSLVFVIQQPNSGPIEFTTKKDGYCSNPYSYAYNSTTYGTSSFQLNRWNHIAATFNDNIQKIYLNGVLVGSGPKVSSPICGTEPLRLGVWWSAEPLYFTGYMDEVRLYSRVLCDEEIQKLSVK